MSVKPEKHLRENCLGVFLLAPSIFFLKFFDTSGGVDKLHGSSVERMAVGADLYFESFLGASCCKGVTTTTGYLGVNVFRVNAVFHGGGSSPQARK